VIDISEMGASGNVFVAASAEMLYDMITDVSRMGEWSSQCIGGAWDDGAGPAEGAWFTGTNVHYAGEANYDRHCQVIVADRPREFAWVQSGIETGGARWGYTFTPVEGGTEVEETSGIIRMLPRLAEFTDEEVEAMIERNRVGIAETLARFKAVAEAENDARSA
jgi:hypothetical protein